MNKIKFVAVAARWFDRVNGNTYHSVKITRTSDGAVLACPYQYGYGDQYRQSALEAMHKAGWLPKKYRRAFDHTSSNLHLYERENDYPITWSVTDGLKRDCTRNGTI